MNKTQIERLQDLNLEYMEDAHFNHMRKPGIRFVPGTGPVNPRIMIIGEAPGRLENARQIPFLGRAGINLANILDDVNIDMHDIYLTNSVKYLPTETSGKPRTPTIEEMKSSRPYLLREIEIVNPGIVALAGRIPLLTIVPELAKKFHEWHGKLYNNRYVPLYHPAVVTHNPSKKGEVRSGYASLRRHAYGEMP